MRRACLQLGTSGLAAFAQLRPSLAADLPGTLGSQPLRVLSALSAGLFHSWPSPPTPAPSLYTSQPLPSSSRPSYRLLHTSTPTHATDKDAALRRLAAARERRERRAERASGSGGGGESRSVGGGGADVVGGVEGRQEGALVPATTTAITPVEGKASEAQLSAALDHPALIVTRPIEWGTVIFGYEQANKYMVYDESGAVVALVAEDLGGLGTAVGRQLLRTRRSFTATVFSADGSQVLFRLRRPAYLVSSTMFVEDGAGAVVGEIHQRWHLLKRNYDLYLGKSQFAAISGTFLAWEFVLQDASGAPLALVDRNFQGFAKEIFTDAGKYVVHFGYRGGALQQHLEVQQQQQQLLLQQQQQAAAGTMAVGQQQQQQSQAVLASGQPQQPQQTQAAVSGSAAVGPGAVAAPPQAGGEGTVGAGAAPPPVTAMAQMRTDVPVIPTQAGNQLVVARPLDLSERMVALACALTIDYDYFSQHSHGSGIVPPVMVIPGAGGGGGEAAPGGAPGPQADVPGAAAAGAASGAVGEAPLGGSGGDMDGDGGWGSVGGVGGAGEGARWEDGGYDAGRSWGEQGGGGDGEMKWDLGRGADGGGGGGGEGGEGGGVVGSILGTLWGLFGGDE